MQNNENVIVDRVLDRKDPAKKINCGVKGKSNEREIVHVLNKRFFDLLLQNPSWGLFSRTLGSGNRFSQVRLSNSATQVFSSDICCPPNFRFSIESKAGYDIDLCSAFAGGNTQIDSFLKQAAIDGGNSKKHPMLLWKKDRKPRLAFIHSDLVKDKSFEYFMIYKNWTIITFDELLKFSDDFFFSLAA